jgi:hypothetical protein
MFDRRPLAVTWGGHDADVERFLQWLWQAGSAGAARNAGAALQDRRRAELVVDAVARRHPVPADAPAA